MKKRFLLPCLIICFLFTAACTTKTATSSTTTLETTILEKKPIVEKYTTISEKKPVAERHTTVSEKEDANVFVFSRENFPRLNGSTSTVPLGEAVASVLLGESREDVADLVVFDRTTNAYSALLRGVADLLIVGEPAESNYEEKEYLGFEWEMEAFATDGFVFLINEQNPVDSLTIEQIQKIYTGEITNWKEVGGEDREIIPFQRDEEAGSQNIMKKLVMDGLEMMEPPTDYLIGSMGGLIDAVKGFDGSPGAIGYTVYYYAEEMNMAGGLKLLSVEGVAPNPKTIQSGEYPFLNPKYVVIDANTPEGSPTRLLFDWILSEEGQRLVFQEGYVPTRYEE